MPTSHAPPTPVVYQIRIVVRGVSPLIWRRVLVRGDTTIADLQATFPLALGWKDEHLHRSVVHERTHGVAHLGGISFRDDPHRVRLAEFGLRACERFLHAYDLTDGWQHEVRVEQVVPLEPRQHYPMCIGGQRACRRKTAVDRWPSWNSATVLSRRRHPAAG